MNKKILIIANKKNYTVDFIDRNLVDLSYVYGENSYFLKKIAKRIWHIIRAPRFDLFFGFRYLDIKRYETIILYECTYPSDVIRFLLKTTNKTKIIYWYWNSIEKQRNTLTYNAQNDLNDLMLLRERYPDRVYLFSFDKDDCKKYQLCYNNQVAPKFRVHLKPHKIKQDVFFCGRDKNRFKYLKKIANLFDSFSITYKFILMMDRNSEYDKIRDQNITPVLEEIPYQNIILEIAESNCVLDLVQQKQGGITWRALEAMFYKKKLLTSFKKIREYDFYRKENVFILGVDDLSTLKEFIQRPYKDIDEDIIRKYTVAGWIENFSRIIHF